MFLHLSARTKLVEGALKPKTWSTWFILNIFLYLGHSWKDIDEGVQAVLLILFRECDHF